MSRRRYLSTTISRDKQVNRLAVECSDFAALLYTWMIPHAGDDGTINGDPEELLMEVVPGRRDKSPADITAALEGMESLGLISWDRDAQRIAFPYEAFYRHQSYIKEDRRRSPLIPAPPDSPPQNSAEQRVSAQECEEEREEAQDSADHCFVKAPASFNPSLQESADALSAADAADLASEPTSIPKPVRDPPGFQAFWSAYPKHEGRAKAVEQWKKLRPPPEQRQAILDALAVQKLSNKWRRGFVMEAARWLRERRWEDEIEPELSPNGLVPTGVIANPDDYRDDAYLDTAGKHRRAG